MKIHQKNGMLTAYGLACGYLNAHRVGDDAQAITMGAEGAVYFVKSRVHRDPQKGREGQTLWLTFTRDDQGKRAAERMFRMLTRSVGPASQTRPHYRDSNPKIDLWILCSDGKTVKYIASTNWWRTVRDALAYYNAGGHVFTYVRGTIDRSER